MRGVCTELGVARVSAWHLPGIRMIRDEDLEKTRC